MPELDSTVNEDLRTLIRAGDTHHRDLRDATDRWIANMQLDVHGIYEKTDGTLIDTRQDDADTPLVVIALREEVCPIDPDARMRIKFMPVHQERDVLIALARMGLYALDAARAIGSPKIWGFVPDKDVIIRRFLGVLERGGVAWTEPEDDPSGMHGGIFYFAEPAVCRPFIERFITNG